jgi:hypothetical protein
MYWLDERVTTRVSIFRDVYYWAPESEEQANANGYLN